MEKINIPWQHYNPVESPNYDGYFPEVISLKDPEESNIGTIPDIDALKLKSYQTTENPFKQEETSPSAFGGFQYFDRFLPNEIVNPITEEKISNNDMVKYFVNKGLSYNQARGLCGNLLHESGGGIHNIVQGGKRGSLKIDGKTGYGLAQWTSRDRQQGLFNFAGTYTPTKKQQLDYVWYELTHGYSKVLDKLKQTKTIEDATRLIMDNYERPSKEHANYNSRLKYARSV